MYFYDNLPFGYVEKGFLTESRNYSNANNYIKTNYTYNSLGLKQSEIDNNGNVTTYAYDSYANPLTVTNTLGQITNVTYNNVLGLQTYSKTPAGAETSTIYDGFGNTKSVSKTNPVNGTLTLSQTESRTYNTNGITVSTNTYSNGSILKDTISTLDSFGRVVKVQEKVDGGAYKTTDYVYNNLGQLVSISYPYSNLWTSLGAGMQSVFTYDDVGRVIKQKLADNESNVVYFVNGKKVYDNTTQTHSKTYLYNTFDKLISVTEKNGNTDQVTKYTWSMFGNLTNITDAEGNVRNFTYDAEGRLLTQEDLHKSTDSTYGKYVYTYDPIGNLVSKADPTGNITTFTYDNLYRPIQEVGPDFNNLYVYDNCINGVGALCSITTNDYTENISYKLGGPILSSTKKIYDETGDKTFTESYGYNDLGQVTNVTLPDSSILNYSYNLIGKQKSVSLTRTINGTASTTNFVTDSQYNIDGTQSNLVYGNGGKTCYGYSLTNGGSVAPRLSGIYAFKNNQDCSNLGNYASSTSLLYAQDLSYNLFGQITGITEKYSGEVGNVSSAYQYDDLNRLTNTTRIDNGVSSTRAQTYSAIGNLLSSGSTNYVYDVSNNANPNAPTLIGTTAMKYDLNGNLLGDGNNLYEWNVKNRMKKSESAKSISEYSYDVSGERIKEKITVKQTATSTLANSVATNTSITATAQSSTTIATTYISESSYTELVNNKLASRGKVEALFALAYSSEYVPKTCFGSTDPNCLKRESVKYVAQFLQQKYKIILSATALEEMYQVYIGKLIFPVSNFPYQKNLKGNYLVNTQLNTVENCKTYFTYYDQYPQAYNASWVKDYKNNCVDNFYYNTSIWATPNITAYMTFDVSATDGRPVVPFRVEVRDGAISGQTIVVATTTTAGSYKVDITNAFTPQKNWSNNGANNMSAWNQITFTPNSINDLSAKAQINNVRITFGQYENTNTINTNVVPTVTQAVIDSEVTAKNNLLLLGAIYKEKIISSLFSNAKYLSEASFNELNNLGIGYSKLIIYDRLVDASFFGYFACDYLSGSAKEDCKKEVFVKYLYAIVKYETDTELSTYSLDEAYEVINGNLRFPNDITEYKIYETKTYSIVGTPLSVNYFYQTSGNVFFNNSNGNNTTNTNSDCPIGNYTSGASNWYHVCDSKFPIPQEVIDRKTELDKAEILLTFSQGLQSNVGTLQPYTAPNLSIYPVTGTTTLTGFPIGGSNITPLYNWNTQASYGTTTTPISLSSANYIDIVRIVKAIVNSDIQNVGLRFFTTNIYNQTNVTNAKAYDLRVTYVRDAEKNDRTYFTPQVLNPEDAQVYAKVLEVLARVDKNYTGGQNISLATYNEIKLTDLLNADTIKQIFQNNVQLQKDLTLSSVWLDIKVNKNTTITREALEELWMVSNDNLSVATNTALYFATSSLQFFDRSKLTNLSVVPGITSSRELVDDYNFSKLFQVSTDTAVELSNAGITNRSQIFPFITTLGFISTSTIKQVDKDEVLVNIYGNILTNTSIKLTREALEEVYYVINGKEALATDDTTNAEKFNRMNFGTLENLHYGTTIVSSKVDQRLDDNIVYNSASSSLKLISDDTKGELSLAGITNQISINNIWNSGTSTSLGSKDAKLYYFYNRVKASTTIELSRMALEEIYLTTTGKLLFPNPFATTTKITSNAIFIKGKSGDGVTYNPNPSDTGTNIGMVSGWFYDMTVSIPTTQLPGHNLSNLTLNITGDVTAQAPYHVWMWALIKLNGGTATNLSKTTDLSKTLDLSMLSTSTARLYANTTSWNTQVALGQPTLTFTYLPITSKFDRTNLGELDTTSSLSDLKNAYDLITNATTTIVAEDNFTPLATSTSPTSPYLLLNTSSIATGTIATTTPYIYYIEVVNPYGYPFTDNGDGTYTFYLPNGATSSDPLTRIYNSVAKNLNINSTSTLSYTKFYPSAYYEYDSRGVVTINVPFNGKVVGTYKYQGELSEVSYIHNSYNSTPVLQTDSTGSITAVIKRDVWGDMLSNNYNSNEIIPTSYGLTGHKWDDNAGITYSHARYLSNKNKVWLSHDPFSIESFSSDIWLNNPQIQNSYSYSTNDPVNKMDPDGKLTIIVPGTFYSNDSWNWNNQNTSFFANVLNTFAQNNGGETAVIWNDKANWSGENTREARTNASLGIAEYIRNYDFKPGEQLNLVGHSHGGNIIKELSGRYIGRNIDNAILFGAPYRDDYSMDMDSVDNYVNVYSYFDATAGLFGGNAFNIEKPGDWFDGVKNTWQEGGKGGWRDGKATKNISITGPTFKSLFTSLPSSLVAGPHGNLWSNGDFWSNYVAPVVKLPDQKKK